MLYMLDTNICSYIIRNKPETSKEKLKTVKKNHTIALSSIVVSELFYGAKKKVSEKLFDLVLTFVENFEVLDFDKNCALSYAEIQVDLESRGNNIGSNDLLIAAHVKGYDAILLTNNTREFEKVNGISIENWIL